MRNNKRTNDGGQARARARHVKGKYVRVDPSDDLRRKHYSPAVFAKADALAERFVSELVPALRAHAFKRFRNARWCIREELAQECVCVGWRDLLNYIEKGEAEEMLGKVGLFVWRVSRQVANCWFVTGWERAVDVLSFRAQRLHGFSVTHASVTKLDNWLDGPLLAG